MTTEGVYTFTATAQAADGHTYTDSIAITVINKAQLDALLKAKWEGMKVAMLAGNIEGAVGYFAESSQNSFRQHFTQLYTKLSEIVADMGLLRMVRVREHFAEYDLRTTRNGTTYSFQVLFIHDLDGIWKIRSY